MSDSEPASPPMFDEEWDHEYAEEQEEWSCEYCNGTGGDPWNDYIMPCEHCDGMGYKWWM